MKKIASCFSIMILILCSVFLSACGDSYKDVYFNLIVDNEEFSQDSSIDIILDSEDSNNNNVLIGVKVKGTSKAASVSFTNNSSTEAFSVASVGLIDGYYYAQIQGVQKGSGILTINLNEDNYSISLNVNIWEKILDLEANESFNTAVEVGGETTISDNAINYYPSTTNQTGVEYSIDSLSSQNAPYVSVNTVTGVIKIDADYVLSEATQVFTVKITSSFDNTLTTVIKVFVVQPLSNSSFNLNYIGYDLNEYVVSSNGITLINNSTTNEFNIADMTITSNNLNEIFTFDDYFSVTISTSNSGVFSIQNILKEDNCSFEVKSEGIGSAIMYITIKYSDYSTIPSVTYSIDVESIRLASSIRVNDTDAEYEQNVYVNGENSDMDILISLPSYDVTANDDYNFYISYMDIDNYLNYNQYLTLTNQYSALELGSNGAVLNFDDEYNATISPSVKNGANFSSVELIIWGYNTLNTLNNESLITSSFTATDIIYLVNNQSASIERDGFLLTYYDLVYIKVTLNIFEGVKDISIADINGNLVDDDTMYVLYGSDTSVRLMFDGGLNESAETNNTVFSTSKYGVVYFTGADAAEGYKYDDYFYGNNLIINSTDNYYQFYLSGWEVGETNIFITLENGVFYNFTVYVIRDLDLSDLYLYSTGNYDVLDYDSNLGFPNLIAIPNNSQVRFELYSGSAGQTNINISNAFVSTESESMFSTVFTSVSFTINTFNETPIISNYNTGYYMAITLVYFDEYAIEQTTNIQIEILVYNQLNSFRLSSYSESLYYDAGYYSDGLDEVSLELIYDKDYITEELYTIIVSFSEDSTFDISNSGLVVVDEISKLYTMDSASTTITLATNESYNLENDFDKVNVYVYVYDFYNTTRQELVYNYYCEITIQSITKVSSITLTGNDIDVIDGYNTIYFDAREGTQSISFTASVNNDATYQSLYYSAYTYNTSGQLVSIAEIVNVSNLGDEYTLTYTYSGAGDGGEMLIRLVPQDAYTAQNTYDFDLYVDIIIQVADGVNIAYRIETVEQLIDIATYPGLLYVLAADLNLEDMEENIAYFNGTLNGALTFYEGTANEISIQYYMDNLCINSSFNYQYGDMRIYSLFSVNEGTLKNIILRNVSIDLTINETNLNTYAISMFVGYNNGLIENSYVEMSSVNNNIVIYDNDQNNNYYIGTVASVSVKTIISDDIMSSGYLKITASDSANICVGGVVGYLYGEIGAESVLSGNYISGYETDEDVILGDISSLTANITSDIEIEMVLMGDVNIENNSNIGGIVGHSSNAKINNISFSGIIDATDFNNIGGLIGFSNTNTTLSYSANYGAIIYGYANVGGISGKSQSSNYILVGVMILPTTISQNNVIIANITGYNSVGGIIGSSTSDLLSYTFVESFYGEDSVDIYILDGGNYIAGLVGLAQSVDISNSYFKGRLSNTENMVEDDAFISGFYNTTPESENKLESSYYILSGIVLGLTTGTDITSNTSYYVYYNTSSELIVSSTYDSLYYTIKIEKVDESTPWYYNINYNNGYYVQVYNSKVFSTVLPTRMTVSIDEDEIDVYGKLIADDEDLKQIYLYLTADTNGIADATLNSVNMNKIFKIEMEPGEASTSVLYTITNMDGSVAYIDRDYLVLTSTGSLILTIYAQFNTALSTEIEVFVDYGYNTFGLYNSEDITPSSLLDNGETFNALTNSNDLIFKPVVENNGYVSNNTIYFDLQFGDSSVGSTDFSEFIFINDEDINTDVLYNIAGNLSVTIGTWDTDDSYIIVSVYGNYYIDLSVTFDKTNTNNGLGFDENTLLDLGEFNFNLKIMKSATKISHSNYVEAEVESGDSVSIDMYLYTDYIKSGLSDDFEGSYNYIDIDNLLGSSNSGNTDELKATVSIDSSSQDVFDSQSVFSNVTNLNEIFDVSANVFLFKDNGYSYIEYKDLTFSLKDEYRYLTDTITFVITFTSVSNTDLTSSFKFTIKPEELSMIYLNHYDVFDISETYSGSTVMDGIEDSNNLIRPSTSGLLAISALQEYSYVDGFAISSSTNAGISVEFEQVVKFYSDDTNYKYVSLFPRPDSYDGITMLEKITAIDKNGNYYYDGQVFVRTIINDTVESDLDYTITVTASNYVGEFNIADAGEYSNTDLYVRLDNESTGKTLVYTKNIFTTTTLITSYKPQIFVDVAEEDDISIEIDSVEYNLIGKNRDITLEIELFGYELGGTPVISFAEKSPISENSTFSSYTATNNGSYIYTTQLTLNSNAVVGSDWTMSVSITISLNGEYETAVDIINFYVVDELMRAEYLSVYGLNTSDVLSMSMYSTREVAFNSSNYIDELNAKIISDVGVDNYLSLFYYQMNVIGGYTNVSFDKIYNGDYVVEFDVYTEEYYDNDDLVTFFGMQAISTASNVVLGSNIYYAYILDNGIVSLKFFTTNDITAEEFDGITLLSSITSVSLEYTLSVSLETSEDNPFPIYSAADFAAMSEGENYILMNDIVLTDWESLDVAIDSLDGNNKLIILESFVQNTSQETEQISSGNIGIFTQIYSNTLIKNIAIDISRMNSTINLEMYTTFNFGFLAGTNAGIITNSTVISDSNYTSTEKTIQIVTDLENDSNTYSGMLVGINSGNITNSRVGDSTFERYIITITDGVAKSTQSNIYSSQIVFTSSGNVAGLVAQNGGNISSCYVANTTIINNTQNIIYDTTSGVSPDYTAGFVAENTASGKIYMSYVKSYGTITTASPRLTTNYIESNGSIGGFVCVNNGYIEDSYSNISISSTSTTGGSSSGGGAGFVFKNGTSGYITRSYSASEVALDNSAYNPFTGKGYVDSIYEMLNYGVIEDCYYVILEGETFSEINDEQATANSVVSMKTSTSLNNFTFLEGGSYDVDSTIWTYSSIGVIISSGVLPDLSSPNLVATSIRYITSEKDSVVYYNYFNSFEYGTEINPYIIRDADEFNELLNQSSSVTEEYEFVGYARQVADIDFSTTTIGVNTGINVTMAGYYDGNGMSISNINVSATTTQSFNSIGLFSKIEKSSNFDAITPIFKNVNLYFTGVVATNIMYVGGLAGTITDAHIMNVNLFATTDDTLISGKNLVGGLAGLISGESKIYNVESNLSVKAGYTSTVEISQSYGTATYYKSYSYIAYNEYVSEEDYEKLLNVKLISSIYSTYDSYLSTLSYAGGLAGVIDIDKNTDDAISSYSNEINVNLITINQVINNSQVDMFIYADNAGGIAGYTSRGVYINRAIFTLSTNDFDFESVSNYINGNFASGGLIGQNYGKISLSEVTNEESLQLEIDNDYAEALINGTATLVETTFTIKGATYAGGLVGINYGGSIENSYTKISLSDCEALYMGGIAGANIGGGYSSVYTTSQLNVLSTSYVGGLIGVTYNNNSYTVEPTVNEAVENQTVDSDEYFALAYYNMEIYTFKHISYNYLNEAVDASVIMNKVVAINNYNIEQLLTIVSDETETISTTAFNGSFGSIVGYSQLSVDGYMGSGITTNEDELVSSYPTNTYYVEYIKDTEGTVYTLDSIGASSTGITTEEMQSLFSVADLYTLLDTSSSNATEQSKEFIELFSTWSISYWQKDSDLYYPLLLKDGYGNVIEIAVEEDLNKINENPTATFLVIANITLTGTYSSCIISQTFSGQIMGDIGMGAAATISGISLENNSSNDPCLAFFHHTSGAVIDNLIFDFINYNFTSYSDEVATGMLIAQDENSVITNTEIYCTSMNVTSSATNSNNSIGGMIGNASGTQISGCSIYADINTSYVDNVGGYIGNVTKEIDSEPLVISSCYFSGNINGVSNDTLNIGGLVGISESATYQLIYLEDATITYYTSNTTERTVNAGGLVGNSSGELFQECYVAVNIISSGDSIVNESYATENVGGMVGYSSNSTYKDCETDELAAYNDSNINFSYEGIEYAETLNYGGLIGSSNMDIINTSNSYIVFDLEKTANEISIDNLVVGGLIGYAYNTDVYSSFSEASISIYNLDNGTASDDKATYVGGLIGVQTNSTLGGTAVLSESAFYGDIWMMNVAGTSYVGGLIGDMHMINVSGVTDSDCQNIVINSQAAGNVYLETLGTIYFGGIVGTSNNTNAVDENMYIQYSMSLTYVSTANIVYEEKHINTILGNEINQIYINNCIYSSDYMFIIDENIFDYENYGRNVINMVAQDLLNVDAVSAAFGNSDNYPAYVYDGSISQADASTIWKIGYSNTTQTMPYLVSMESILSSQLNFTGSFLRPNVLSVGSDGFLKGTIDNEGYNVMVADAYVYSTESLSGRLYGSGYTLTVVCTSGYIQNGLFDTITETGAISNINIDYTAYNSTDGFYTIYSNVGLVADTNYGQLFTVGVVPESEMIIKITSSVAVVSGLVAKNYGNILFSFSSARMYFANTTSNTYTLSNVSGIAYENEGIIDSSYFTGALMPYQGDENVEKVVFSSSSTFVHSNSGNITNSYVAASTSTDIDAFTTLNGGNIVDCYYDVYASFTDSVTENVTQKITYEFLNGNVYENNNSWRTINYDNSAYDIVYNYGYPIVNTGQQVWDSFDKKFTEIIQGQTTGTGLSASSPLQIPNYGILDYISSIDNLNRLYLKLMNDITIKTVILDSGASSMTDDWVVNSKYKNGSFTISNVDFDGNDKIISNLYSTSFGLFDTIENSEVYDLTLANITVDGGVVDSSNYSSPLATNFNSGTIDNVDIMKDTTVTAYSGAGLITNMSSGTIQNCNIGTSAIINAKAGFIYSMSGGTIDNCTVYGIVGSNANQSFSGFVYSVAGGKINLSTFSGTVYGYAGFAYKVSGDAAISENVITVKLIPPTTINSTDVGGLVAILEGGILDTNVITLNEIDTSTNFDTFGYIAGKMSAGTAISNTLKVSNVQINAKYVGVSIGYMSGGKLSENILIDDSSTLGNTTESTSFNADNPDSSFSNDIDIATGGIVGYYVAGEIYDYSDDSDASITISGTANVGGAIGYAKTTPTTISSSPEFITIGTQDATNVYYNIGGVFGYLNASSTDNHIDGFTNYTSIDFDKFDIVYNVGGIVGGYNKDSVGGITNCTNDGDIYVQAGVYVGGIIGYLSNDSDSEFVIDNIENKSSVQGAIYVGGLIGYIDGVDLYATATVEDTYSEGVLELKDVETDKFVNTGNVSGIRFTGGIVGYTNSNIIGLGIIDQDLIDNETVTDVVEGDWYSLYDYLELSYTYDEIDLQSYYNILEEAYNETIVSSGNVYAVANYTTSDYSEVGSADYRLNGIQNIINNNYNNDVFADYGVAGGIAGYSSGKVEFVEFTGEITNNANSNTLYANNTGGIVGYYVGEQETINLSVLEKITEPTTDDNEKTTTSTTYSMSTTLIDIEFNNTNKNSGDVSGYQNVGGLYGANGVTGGSNIVILDINASDYEKLISPNSVTNTDENKTYEYVIDDELDSDYFDISSGTVEGAVNVGGIVGINFNSIQTAYYDYSSESTVLSRGNYISSDVNGIINVGGIVGYSKTSISGIYASNSVGEASNIELIDPETEISLDYSPYIFNGSTNAELFLADSDSNWYQESSKFDLDESANFGGIAGYSVGSITNSIFTGSVDGEDNVGGIVGMTKSTIRNSIVMADSSSDSISGSESVGGIVGWLDGASVSWCYNIYSDMLYSDFGAVITDYSTLKLLFGANYGYDYASTDTFASSVYHVSAGLVGTLDVTNSNQYIHGMHDCSYTVENLIDELAVYGTSSVFQYDTEDSEDSDVIKTLLITNYTNSTITDVMANKNAYIYKTKEYYDTFNASRTTLNNYYGYDYDDDDQIFYYLYGPGTIAYGTSYNDISTQTSVISDISYDAEYDYTLVFEESRQEVNEEDTTAFIMTFEGQHTTDYWMNISSIEYTDVTSSELYNSISVDPLNFPDNSIGIGNDIDVEYTKYNEETKEEEYTISGTSYPTVNADYLDKNIIVSTLFKYSSSVNKYFTYTYMDYIFEKDLPGTSLNVCYDASYLGGTFITYVEVQECLYTKLSQVISSDYPIKYSYGD